MLTLALTGGIASGKSSVARYFAELGAYVIDADSLAREVVEPGRPALSEIEREWGPTILLDDGSLDRARLASIVFGDEDALARLNAITHPRVGELFEERLAQFEPDSVVIYDVPLLVGTERELTTVANVSVAADESVRIRRMVDIRGMSEVDAQRRIDSQVTDEERASISDVVIANVGSEDELRDNVRWLWSHWVQPFRQALTSSGGLGHQTMGSPPPDIELRTDIELHCRRLLTRGIECRLDGSALLTSVAPREVDLLSAGWRLTGPDEARCANPAVSIALTW